MEETSVLTRARRIPTATWSDALDHFGIVGVTGGLQRRTGRGRVAGRAVTARMETGGLGHFPVGEFRIGEVLAAAGPDDVVVLDLGGAEVSSFGGLAALAAVRRGVVGVVVEGACRDLEEIEATGLVVASRHVTPLSAKGRLRLDALNARVQCGGVPVSPGDCVIADETGIVVVPSARLEEVLRVAEQLDQRDHQFKGALESGAAFDAAAKALGTL